MKLLILGDAHITNKRPKRRKDVEYLGTCLRKLLQVEDIYRNKNCDLLIQTGDLYDSFKASHEVVAALTRFFRKAEMKVVTTFGQHDISGHSAGTLKKSPLAPLVAGGLLTLAHAESGAVEPFATMPIIGAGFGEKIISNPKYHDLNFNILVVHQMVGNEELYPGQPIVHPNKFLKIHKQYDLIICGDYHYRFLVKDGNRWCINPGAMMRKTAGKRDLVHKPAVVLFDTQTKQPEVIELNVAPVEEAFDLSENAKASELNHESLQKFLDNLKETEGMTISWQHMLTKLFHDKKIGSAVQELISEAIAEVREGKK